MNTHEDPTRFVEAVRTIEPELLLQEMRSGRHITIVDVRERAAFSGPSGRIPGSISMPMHLAARSEELGCHKSEPVVVVSKHGTCSRLAALELELAGFTEVQSLDGGLHRWIELGFPVAFVTTPPSSDVTRAFAAH